MLMIFYIAVGTVAGTLSGLLGIGGGIVVVPLLHTLFLYYGIHGTSLMHSAIATSLAIMLFTTSSSAYAHYRQGHLQLSLFYRFVPGLIVGAFLGALVAQSLSSGNLQAVFSLFLLLIALRLWISPHKEKQALPSRLGLNGVSMSIGALGGLLGIGGGVLSVPYVMRFKISTAAAVALGALLSFTVAIVGVLSWCLLSFYRAVLESTPSVHYIDWPAALMAGITGVLIAPFAAKWAKRWSELYLRRALALVLLLLFFQKVLSEFM